MIFGEFMFVKKSVITLILKIARFLVIRKKLGEINFTWKPVVKKKKNKRRKVMFSHEECKLSGRNQVHSICGNKLWYSGRECFSYNLEVPHLQTYSIINGSYTHFL